MKPDPHSYQGIVIVVGGKKLLSEQVCELMPAINDHHDGKLTHGQLMTKINKSLNLPSDWDYHETENEEVV